MLDVPTTRVAYVKVTPTISNWIQPIAIELQVWTGLLFVSVCRFVCLFVGLFVCMSLSFVCLSVCVFCLSFCLSVLSVCLSVCLSNLYISYI